MSIDCLYKDIDWCKTGFYKSDDCICDSTVIVPDFMGDIIKTVSVSATALISESKAVSGRIEITGQVRFNVLYISEDESSRISSICVTTPFSHFISSPDITDSSVVLVHTDSTLASFTPINSRKLKVSARLRFSADTYTVMRTKALYDAPGCETKKEELTIPSYKVICSKNIVVTANADLPAGKNAIGKILKQSATLTDSDFKPLNNKVVLKGNIALSILYDGDSITDATVTIPFTEVAEAEGVTPSLTNNIFVSVADWDIKPDTDLSGDYKMLDATVILRVDILSYSPQTFPCITDLFLPRALLNTEQSTVNALTQVSRFFEEEFVKDSIALPKQSPGLEKIIDMSVSLCDCVTDDESVTLTADVTFIYTSGDIAFPVNTYSTKIPITHKLSTLDAKRVCARIKHTGFAIVSDNSVDVRLGISFELFCDKTTRFTHYTYCETAECSLEKRASIIVSCVNEGDSLWSIAKKYNIPLSHLSASNALDPSSALSVGEKLIIPR